MRTSGSRTARSECPSAHHQPLVPDLLDNLPQYRQVHSFGVVSAEGDAGALSTATSQSPPASSSSSPRPSTTRKSLPACYGRVCLQRHSACPATEVDGHLRKLLAMVKTGVMQPDDPVLAERVAQIRLCRQETLSLTRDHVRIDDRLERRVATALCGRPRSRKSGGPSCPSPKPQH